MRRARVLRETRETRIEIVLDLEGGDAAIRTGVPFLDHMLDALARHAGFGLQLDARGDLEVEPHHTVEDAGITLGQAFRQAVGEGRGIRRFASIHAPMDDALVLAALDVSGRPFLHYGVSVERVLLGTFATDLAEEFFRAFTINAAVTLHLVQVHGRDPHHVLEAAFKATGIVLGVATRVGGDAVPSTKGVL